MPGRLVHIPIWWVIVGVMTSVLTPILTIWASVQISERTIQQTIAESQRAQAEARAESLVRYCRLLASQIDVYSEATTPVGRDAYRTWLSEYQIQGCQPPRR